MPGSGGEDDERLPVEAGQRRRLPHRCRPREELLEVADEIAGGRGIGPRLVPRARRQGVGGQGEQGGRPQASHRGQQGGDATGPRCRARPQSAGRGPIWARWSPAARGRRPDLGSGRRRPARTSRRKSGQRERRAREHGIDRAACAARRLSVLRPAYRRRRRSTRGRGGHRRRLCCLGRRSARSRRGPTTPHPGPVPGRQGAAPSRCTGGAAGARQHLPEHAAEQAGLDREVDERGGRRLEIRQEDEPDPLNGEEPHQRAETVDPTGVPKEVAAVRESLVEPARQ